MNDFIEYIENSSKNFPDTQSLYTYKRKILNELTNRANEITSRGLTDEKVLNDLIKDEYPDLNNLFNKFVKEDKAKEKRKTIIKFNLIGSAIYIVLMFAIYFVSSALTHRWDLTWLIIVGGVFALTIYGFSYAINKLFKMSHIFHHIARILVASCVMMIAVFTFLYSLMFNLFPNAWTVVIVGVIAMLFLDGLLAYFTNQKFRIINYLLYIPSIATLLYVILGAFGVVTWSAGWLIIIAGVVLDLVVMVCEIIRNTQYIRDYKSEEDDEWNEN